MNNQNTQQPKKKFSKIRQLLALFALGNIDASRQANDILTNKFMAPKPSRSPNQRQKRKLARQTNTRVKK